MATAFLSVGFMRSILEEICRSSQWKAMVYWWKTFFVFFYWSVFMHVIMHERLHNDVCLIWSSIECKMIRFPLSLSWVPTLSIVYNGSLAYRLDLFGGFAYIIHNRRKSYILKWEWFLSYYQIFLGFAGTDAYLHLNRLGNVQEPLPWQIKLCHNFSQGSIILILLIALYVKLEDCKGFYLGNCISNLF